MEVINRQTAYYCTIRDLITGEYIRKEGWEPNYIATSIGALTRVRISGIIIEATNANTIIIDDGTGKITTKLFDNIINATIGEPVLIIGRPRKNNEEIFIAGEIIKKLPSTTWLKFLAEERKKLQKYVPPVPEENNETTNNEKEETTTEEPESLLEIIRSLDTGEGAPTDEVIKKAINKIPDVEEKIKFLIIQGEIFELRPGRIKVLE